MDKNFNLIGNINVVDEDFNEMISVGNIDINDIKVDGILDLGAVSMAPENIKTITNIQL